MSVISPKMSKSHFFPTLFAIKCVLNKNVQHYRVWTTPLAAVARVPVAATSLKIAGHVTHVSVSFNATDIHVGSHVDTVLKVCIGSVCVRCVCALCVCLLVCVCV